MLIKTLIILQILIVRTLSYIDNEEAVVETVSDIVENETQDMNVKFNNLDNDNTERVYIRIKPEDGRNGRLLWSYPQSPMIDLIKKTTAINYAPKDSSDLFDFLRDSYPLPGGLKYPLPEYDFIIVGAGSAGCVLASRLTEDSNTTVLLLEAGKPEMLLTDIPSMAPYFQATDYTWQYYMEPQPGVCMGMINERCFWPRGKAVGGTSVINYNIYTRGRLQDWDRIAADGNEGWSYNEILKYYIKSEKAFLDGYEKGPHRGTDGELAVEFVPTSTKLLDAFLEAGKILGIPTVDYNVPGNLGFGKVQVTINNGCRQSTAKVFLRPHKKRPNLHILPESTVTKVLIDKSTNTAYGVKYVRNRLKYEVKARREVILSAGPIASPQLLMLSGIGPKDHLSAVGIPIVQDLPVGETLYDHICFPGIIFTLNVTNISFNESKTLTLRSFIEWIRNGDNDITTPGGVEAIGYIKTPISDDPEPVPDIELISIGGSIVVDGGPGGSKAVRKGMKISDEVFNEAFGSIDNTDTWSTIPMLLHPRSVGKLELRNNNPFSHPVMIGNYLTDSRDTATFVAAIRHIEALAATAPFQALGAKLHHAQYPACRALQFDSDEYWECAVRTLTATLHHQVATCRMGPDGDPRAVLDPQLRVRGVRRLRVADSGVIPRTVSAHTNAPAIMIGEKAADMIKQTWEKVEA